MNIQKALLLVAVILFVIGALIAGNIITASLSPWLFAFWGLAFGFGSVLI